MDKQVAIRSVLIKNMIEGLSHSPLSPAPPPSACLAHAPSFAFPPLSVRALLALSCPADLGDTENPIPLPNVSSNVMKKVLEWCEQHKGDPEPVPEDNEDSRRKTTDISEWDQKCQSLRTPHCTSCTCA